MTWSGKEAQARYRAQTSYARRYHKPWTAREDALVLAHAEPDRDLSRRIGRSIASISARRWRLTRQDPNNNPTEEVTPT